MKAIKTLKGRVSLASASSARAFGTGPDRSVAGASLETEPQARDDASPRFELFGFDAAQSKEDVTPWIVPSILQKTGVACVNCPPHLTNAARSWITSTLSGAASVGEFRVEEPVAQAILLLSKPGPAELSLITNFLACHASAPPVEVHLLCNGTQAVSPAEGAFQDLVRNRLKPKGSTGKALAVIHLTLRPVDFAGALQREAVVEQIRSLQRAGFSLLVYWEDPGSPPWSLPHGLADTTLTISKHHRPEVDKAFKAYVTASRFVDGDTLPPMAVYVKKNVSGSAKWTSEQYICDDPQLLTMYRMKAGGATMKQIGAVLDIDPSTVCRNLKALERELAAR